MCDCGYDNVISDYADDVHRYCEEIDTLKREVKSLTDENENLRAQMVCANFALKCAKDRMNEYNCDYERKVVFAAYYDMKNQAEEFLRAFKEDSCKKS